VAFSSIYVNITPFTAKFVSPSQLLLVHCHDTDCFNWCSIHIFTPSYQTLTTFCVSSLKQVTVRTQGGGVREDNLTQCFNYVKVICTVCFVTTARNIHRGSSECGVYGHRKCGRFHLLLPSSSMIICSEYKTVYILHFTHTHTMWHKVKIKLSLYFFNWAPRY
jgi:hypothetical protein